MSEISSPTVEAPPTPSIYSSNIAHLIHGPDPTPYVERLLADGFDVNTPLGYPGTLLTMALRIPNVELARYLIARGADVVAASIDEPPAVTAVKYCQYAFVDELVTGMTARVFARSGGASAGDSKSEAELKEVLVRALTAAVTYGRVEAVRGLLKRGVDPNALPYPESDPRRVPGETGNALHAAARCRPQKMGFWDNVRGKKGLFGEDEVFAIVEALLEAGGEPRLVVEGIKTPLSLAYGGEGWSGKAKVIDLLDNWEKHGGGGGLAASRMNSKVSTTSSSC